MSKQKFRLVLLSIFALVIFAAGSGWALAALNLPQPTGYVNDFAGMLSPQTKGELESKLKDYEQKSGNEIAIVTVPNLQGTTIDNFAVRLFEKWKIGKKGKDNGVLLLMSKEERKTRIEVGYGLEPDLTDAESYGIIKNIIIPEFKARNFDKGVVGGVNAIIKAIAGNDVTAIGGNSSDEGSRMGGRSFVAFIKMGWLFLAVIFPWLAAVMARTRSWWLGGAVGAVISLIIMIFSITAGVIAIAVLTPLGLLFDFAISRAFDEHKKRKSHGDDSYIPWWAGGGWGPGGSGGSSGGGFGGFGGGSSGGGGASGGW